MCGGSFAIAFARIGQNVRFNSVGRTIAGLYSANNIRSKAGADQGGTLSMKKLAVAILLLPLACGGASAQAPAGSPAAGKAYWEREAPRVTACRNCHGGMGEGGFGPDLAGRGLNAAQFARAVRQPWGIMPAFVESQLSDQDAADLAAYFAAMPKVAEPAKWRVDIPAGAPPGQANMINIGCGQCHGATFNGPRANMGAVNMDFDYFANLVYNHTTAMAPHRAALGINATNLDMGNYSRTRLSAGTLRSMYFWARDEIGVRVPLAGTLSKGEAGPSGVTYTLTVTNNGLQGKGVIAEGLTISLIIPADTTVVAATGTGYQGIGTDEKTKAGVATWQLPRSAPKDQERITITLSKPATAASNLRGEIRWAKPAPKTGRGDDVVAIAAAPL
jgi:cytochrome c553